MTRGLAFVCLLVVGCKYGGSDEDPIGGYEPGTAVDLGKLDASAEVDSNSPSSPPKSSASVDAGKIASSSGLDAAKPPMSSAGGKCEPAQPVAVCDPVRNTGCPPIPLMQCDADITLAEPTGRCSIYTPTPIVPCSATTTAMSTACWPNETCVADQCRKLCYCDDDCADGQTCSDSAGPFKLCK